MSNWHIVYPCGDRTKLCVVEICEGLEYELADYAVASRKSFPSEDEAVKYARALAETHGLVFEGDSRDSGYLD